MSKAKMGPKTEAGRMAVAGNAVSHGMWTERTVIPGMEDEAEWERYLKGITENLAPEGALEQELAARIASLLWRLRRVTRHETATTRDIIEGIQSEADDANARIAAREDGSDLISAARVYKDQERHLVLDARNLDNIMRYEAHLHRQCLQTLHELEALQARRRGETPHLARLDVSASPAAYLTAARERSEF